MKKNHYEIVDAIIYRIRRCAVENQDGCGKGCECNKLKEQLLELFHYLFVHLIDKHAMYPCYTYKDDFEQELKMRLIELIYEWDDTRGIFFVTYVQIMLHRWVMKVNNVVYGWTQKKLHNYIIYEALKPDNTFDKDLNNFYSDEYIESLMGDLTEKQRQVIKYRYEQELKVNEIADRFEVSPGAVSNLLKRAYKIIGDNVKAADQKEIDELCKADLKIDKESSQEIDGTGTPKPKSGTDKLKSKTSKKDK